MGSMAEDIEEQNKMLVLKAFDTLFNQRDYPARNAFGHPVTSSTALTLRRAATACSI